MPPTKGRPAAHPPAPVLWGMFADPTVERLGDGYVGLATGELNPRAFSLRPHGAWRRTRSALTRLPSWSRPGTPRAGTDVWASDLTRIGGRWVLYFSAPVRGVGKYGRCVGVATSSRALGGFAPVAGPPLVCPAALDVPTALDPLLPRDPSLPKAGVIDPWFFRDTGGAPYLVYKTDRIPSSLRLLPLRRDGLAPKPGAVSRELVRYNGVLENPVLVHRPSGYTLIASEGDWTKCGYRTVWYHSASLDDWSATTSGTLMDQTTTGLCGPGGADLATRLAGAPATGPGGGIRVYLHAWTCDNRPTPCRGRKQLKWDHARHRKGLRSMYAATLTWQPDGSPALSGWLSAPLPERPLPPPQ